MKPLRVRPMRMGGLVILLVVALWRMAMLGRLQPYIGAGAGVIIPFVRADLNGSRTREYQIGAPTAQAFVGLNIDLISHISILTEGQFSFIKADLDLNGGGHLETEAFTSHFIFGLSVSF